MDRKTVDIIYNTIVKQNQRDGQDSIPQTDILYKNFISTHGIDKEIMLKALSILKDAHKILAIEIAKENNEHNIDKIEGYVDADLDTLRRLSACFETALVDQYEKECRKRLGPYQIIKEIFPRLGQLNNTPMGLIANQAIMLSEYYKLIIKDYYEYTDKFKEDKLRRILKEEGWSTGGADRKEPDKEDEAAAGEEPKRAVDSDTFPAFSNDAGKYSIDKILNIYGSNFFFRVYLRKYEFEFLSTVIQKGVIAKKQDLELLRSMIGKMKSNFDRDDKLAEYTDQISALEREITRSIVTRKR